jgi:hypothetical protein
LPPRWFGSFSQLGREDKLPFDKRTNKAVIDLLTRSPMFEAEVNRIAGEIALLSSEPDAAKAEAHFARALTVARA